MACDDEEAAVLDQESSWPLSRAEIRRNSEDPFAVMFDSNGIAVRLQTRRIHGSRMERDIVRR
jgi:hypothetical protein